MTDASGAVVATGLNTAATDGQAGPIEFTSIEITAPGSYAYTVRQTGAGQTVGGVTNSAQEFAVRIDATDDGQGGLVCDVTYPDGGTAFESAYSLQGVTAQVALEGTVTLVGRDMAAGEFGFAVYDGQGSVVASGRNVAAVDGQPGGIEFGALAIFAPGEYDFSIAQVAGDAAGVTYDTRAYAVHVSATDNLDGTMSAQVSYPDGTPAFANACVTPEQPGGDTPGGEGQGGDTPSDPDKPDAGEGAGGSVGQGGSVAPEVPKTGDVSNGAVAAALAAAGTVLARRRGRGGGCLRAEEAYGVGFALRVLSACARQCAGQHAGHHAGNTQATPNSHGRLSSGAARLLRGWRRATEGRPCLPIGRTRGEELLAQAPASLPEVAAGPLAPGTRAQVMRDLMGNLVKCLHGIGLPSRHRHHGHPRAGQVVAPARVAGDALRARMRQVAVVLGCHSTPSPVQVAAIGKLPAA